MLENQQNLHESALHAAALTPTPPGDTTACEEWHPTSRVLSRSAACKAVVTQRTPSAPLPAREWLSAQGGPLSFNSPLKAPPVGSPCQRPPRCRWQSRSRCARPAWRWMTAGGGGGGRARARPGGTPLGCRLTASPPSPLCSCAASSLPRQLQAAGGRSRGQWQPANGCRAHLDDAWQRGDVCDLPDSRQEAAVLRHHAGFGGSAQRFEGDFRLQGWPVCVHHKGG